MAWYLFAGISLAWIAALYLYCYFNRLTTEKMIVLGYGALFAVWPIIVLKYGLIQVSPVLSAILLVELICLFILPIKVSGNFSWVARFLGGMAAIEKVVLSLFFAFFLAVAPFGLAANYAFTKD